MSTDNQGQPANTVDSSGDTSDLVLPQDLGQAARSRQETSARTGTDFIAHLPFLVAVPVTAAPR